MVRATVRHILVDTKEGCEEIKKQIEEGGDFADFAKEHSRCPTGRRGGGMGECSPGQIIKELDQVVFSEEIGVVHGPVQTQLGFHLIEITSRSE